MYTLKIKIYNRILITTETQTRPISDFIIILLLLLSIKANLIFMALKFCTFLMRKKNDCLDKDSFDTVFFIFKRLLFYIRLQCFKYTNM